VQVASLSQAYRGKPNLRIFGHDVCWDSSFTFLEKNNIKINEKKSKLTKGVNHFLFCKKDINNIKRTFIFTQWDIFQ